MQILTVTKLIQIKGKKKLRRQKVCVRVHVFWTFGLFTRQSFTCERKINKVSFFPF